MKKLVLLIVLMCVFVGNFAGLANATQCPSGGTATDTPSYSSASKAEEACDDINANKNYWCTGTYQLPRWGLCTHD